MQLKNKFEKMLKINGTIEVFSETYGKANVIFTPEYVTVLSCENGDATQLERMMEEEAKNSSQEEGRNAFHVAEDVGSRLIPSMMCGIATSFNKRVYPAKDVVISFIGIDDRYPNLYLWKKYS